MAAHPIIASPEEGKAGALRVCLVEHDPVRSRLIADYLSGQQIDVTCESRGDSAYEAVSTHTPNLVIIESNAPGLNGQEFCRRLRNDGNMVPIMILADEGDMFDQILCLELGADDYVVNEAPGRLLWARLKAVLRRAMASGSSATATKDTLRFGNFVLDKRGLEIRFNGQTVNLTLHEFNCVWLLAERAGTAVSRDDIRRALQGGGSGIHGRSVDTQIARVRQKIDQVDPACNRIKSVRSIGYLFSPAGL
jgi:two-component system response regulator RstA